MNSFVNTAFDLKLQTLKTRLENKNFKVTIVENKNEAVRLVEELIPNNSSVAVGGSQTLFETGIIDKLHAMNIRFIDRYEANLSFEQLQERLRAGLTADYFLTSTNALSMDGNLYNIDATGNRVAAMIYGPKNVLVFVSLNKIFDDEASAVSHVRNVAAVANCIRYKKNTPCTKVGYCVNCNDAEKLCSNFVKQERSHFKERIHIILIKEEYGF